MLQYCCTEKTNMGKTNYLGTAEAAARMGITSRRVVGLCREGKLNGAFQDGRNWKIPESSVSDYEALGFSHARKLPCAVGNTCFSQIAMESYYVDKTLLIRELVDSHNTVTLFTRPRRFGKTLMIDMLKTFFEKKEENTAVYFKDKDIWKCGKKYRDLQGKYPVIALNFKDVKYSSWNDSMEAIRLIIKEEYHRHAEIFSAEFLSSDEQSYLERLKTGLLSDVEFSRSLLVLIKLLKKYHHENVIVLIDEYDTPIQNGYANGFYEETIRFMRTFLSGGLKDNPDLQLGVLTGIMRISKENLFSGLNNLFVDTVLDEKYSAYFGFTAEEVQKMADYYEVSEKMEELQRWYDGYQFGRTEIYNPWSVANYFANDCKARPYWVNTSDNEIIRQLLKNISAEIADCLIDVMQGKELLTSLNMEVIYPAVSEGMNTIFSFLFLAGYLTLIEVPQETEFGTYAMLRLPNMEVRRIYNSEILFWIRRKTNETVVAQIEKAMLANNPDALHSALESFMTECISYYDGASESFYHGMMLGLLACLSSRYRIRSNREAGDGRFDVQMEPKIQGEPGILMEFKAADSADTDHLEKTAQKALGQIFERHYDSDMAERGITNIICYGVAFSGKHSAVKMEKRHCHKLLL